MPSTQRSFRVLNSPEARTLTLRTTQFFPLPLLLHTSSSASFDCKAKKRLVASSIIVSFLQVTSIIKKNYHSQPHKLYRRPRQEYSWCPTRNVDQWIYSVYTQPILTCSKSLVCLNVLCYSKQFFLAEIPAPTIQQAHPELLRGRIFSKTPKSSRFFRTSITFTALIYIFAVLQIARLLQCPT